MRKARFGVRRVVPVVVVIASLVLALAAATARANESAASVSFAGGGKLVTNPGPVTVSLKYDCVPPSPGFISISIDENGTSDGGDVVDAICDDKSHTVTVTIDGLFTPGVAAGTAMITNSSGGAFATANQEINIKAG